MPNVRPRRTPGPHVHGPRPRGSSGRRAGQALALVLVASLAGACSGGSDPAWTLRPTPEPLRYELASEVSNFVETPGGPTGTDITTESEVAVSIGAVTAGGQRPFSVTYASFEATVDAGLGAPSRVDGGGFAGLRIAGASGPAGALAFDSLPDVSAGSFDAGSLAGVVPDLLPALPPGGDAAAGPWDHGFTMPMGGGVSGEITYSGTARFAGDTTWEGISARRILSEGRVTFEGSGTPAGAPGPIEMKAEGDSRTLYVWDPARGVLLASESESEASGTVRAMGFDMPLVVRAESRTRVRP
ncbi:MAG: hypothetical protein RRA92_05765 [Gemmatimonadota bacterium]|nr:hypothetical protein [Gemmatimonadota bacterium]